MKCILTTDSYSSSTYNYQFYKIKPNYEKEKGTIYLQFYTENEKLFTSPSCKQKEHNIVQYKLVSVRNLIHIKSLRSQLLKLNGFKNQMSSTWSGDKKPSFCQELNLFSRVM